MGVFDGEVESGLVDVGDVDGPAVGGVGFSFLKLDKFGHVALVEGVSFAEVAAGV